MYHHVCSVGFCDSGLGNSSIICVPLFMSCLCDISDLMPCSTYHFCVNILPLSLSCNRLYLNVGRAHITYLYQYINYQGAHVNQFFDFSVWQGNKACCDVLLSCESVTKWSIISGWRLNF